MERLLRLNPRRTATIKIKPGEGIVYANTYALDILNYDLTEIIGQKPKIVCHADMPEVIHNAIGKLIFNYTEGFAILKHKSKYERYFWTFVRFKPSYKSNGSFDSFITQRKPVPEKLLKQNLSLTLSEIEQLYDKLKSIELHASIDHAQKYLEGYLEERGYGNLGEYYLSFFKSPKKLPKVFELNEASPVKEIKKFYLLNLDQYQP